MDRPGDGADQQRRLCESRFPRARSVITPPRAMDPPPPDAGEDLPAGAVDPSAAYHAAYAAVGPPPGVAPPPGIAPPEGDPPSATTEADAAAWAAYQQHYAAAAQYADWGPYGAAYAYEASRYAAP